MDSQDRSWMYNMTYPGRRGYRPEFRKGVDEFIDHAKSLPEYQRDGKIICPCKNCKLIYSFPPDDVKYHLLTKGFKRNYLCWTYHGEVDTVNPQGPIIDYGGASTSQGNPLNACEDMVQDAARQEQGYEHEDVFSQSNNEEEPNEEARTFFDFLDKYNQPLWPGCQNHSLLSIAARLMSIKSDWNVPQDAMDEIVQLMSELCPSEHSIPKNFYEAKKIMATLGLKSMKIDCCVNGCMLYWKDDADQTQCKFCGSPRYKFPIRKKPIPVRRMYYLPLIPRLKRLYGSMSSAPHMRWHAENSRAEGIMSHPSDGNAWKNFDRLYPEFASDPRNVRLGLCTDGFTPFNQSATPYSCWPVIVTPYNLPPEMCMTMPYMFLTCIIPGPKNPKANIDVYLQPLIDELKLLWDTGVPTYDVSTKQNFQLKATLMWTVNDFPAYGMVSGWMTAGKLACPYCMNHNKAFTLKNGRKNCWFDCHRKFLERHHPYRRNTRHFKKGHKELGDPPPKLTGVDVWESVRDLPKITEEGSASKLNGYGLTHNWKKQSIFWELPYWKDNLIRHNLDVMHIEKNVFDNIFNTVLDIKDKTKDTVKARMDLAELCQRPELELKLKENGQWAKPKAMYTLTREQRRTICEWVKELRMPDGYSSNLARRVDIEHGRFIGMKSHDCHIFMEQLLPIAFRELPDEIWKPLAELSKYFRDLCSTTLKLADLDVMEKNIAIILCKLERIFPPGFFDVMEHLPIHLIEEARNGGPVQFRWMYPFERYLGKLKKTVMQKARVEGSICEAYLRRETSHFCSYYFQGHVHSHRTRVCRNDDGGVDESAPPLSIFNQSGRTSGACKTRYLDGKERRAATLHVLLNCDEVQPFINIFIELFNIAEEEAYERIGREFAAWFQSYVQDPINGITSQFIRELACGPNNEVKTWPVYFVNGFKFHTRSWGENKKTMNSGVSVRGSNDGKEEYDFYGMLNEIVELEYPGELVKRVVLFKCDWFDPTPTRGTRIVHPESNTVEVRERGRYGNYDPFIIAQQARQVYYIPYPGNIRDKMGWLAVIKSKAKGRIEIENSLEVAYQNDMPANVNISIHDEFVATLNDHNNLLENVDVSELHDFGNNTTTADDEFIDEDIFEESTDDETEKEFVDDDTLN